MFFLYLAYLFSQYFLVFIVFLFLTLNFYIIRYMTIYCHISPSIKGDVFMRVRIGYYIDFYTLIEIYKSSRKRTDFLEYKVNLIRDHEFLNSLDNHFKLK